MADNTSTGSTDGASGGQGTDTLDSKGLQKEKKKPRALPRTPNKEAKGCCIQFQGAIFDISPDTLTNIIETATGLKISLDKVIINEADKCALVTLDTKQDFEKLKKYIDSTGINGSYPAVSEMPVDSFLQKSEKKQDDGSPPCPPPRLSRSKSKDNQLKNTKPSNIGGTQGTEKEKGDDNGQGNAEDNGWTLVEKPKEDLENGGGSKSKKDGGLEVSGDYENVDMRKNNESFEQSGKGFHNDLNIVDDDDDTSKGEDADTNQHNTSIDSDDVGPAKEGDEEDGANGDLASISPPSQAMVESINSLPEDNQKGETKKENEKENEKVAAEGTSKGSSAGKKSTFQLKLGKGGKFCLIKSDACKKPFSYTPRYGEVTIDEEDDLLYDGDHQCYKIEIEDGIIKLDEIVAAKTTNSTPVTQTKGDVKCSGDGSASLNSVNRSEHGSGDVGESTDQFNKLELHDGEDDKLIKKEQTACEKPEQFELKYFFCHILESSEFKKEFQKEFGNVKLGHDKLDEENKTIVYLQSEGAEESMEARKWICELQEDFPCTSFDYKDLNDLNPILSKSGHLIRQLMMKFIKQEDVHHETNETAQMIHIWSKSLRQAEVDKIGSNVKKSIQIKPEIISMSITDLKKHVSQSNELSSEEKEFVKIESQGDKAKLTGLAYIVDRIIKLISGGHQSYSDGGATHQQKGPTHTTAKEPAPQDMDREPSAQGADPGLNWNVEQLLDFEDHKLLVSVTNIPTDKTREDLQSELKCQSASGPRLVYQNGKREALLIFKDLKDKGQFKDKPDKYIFDRSKKRVLGNLSLAINPTVWKKLPLCTQDKLEQGLHEIGVTLIKAEGVMKAPTLYQLQVAKEVVTNMTKESTVDEVTVIVWRIVSILQRQTIAEIETNCGKKITFSEEKFQIRMPAMSKGLEDSFDTLKTAIDDMKENSIQDVPLENKEVQKAEEACKQMGEGCCIFDKKSKTVFIYANSFEDFTKYKFQFDIKIGRKKTTGRGDRSNAQVVSPDEASSENKTSQGQSENNTKRKVSSHMSSLEKNAFMTPEGIKVLVYKGSIVRLDVDCIVNAANSRLSNGGGVARAISEAAGDKFERECKHYINTNGKLPVGEACSTTAGNLDYKCVIHTVGPAWYDYSKTSQGRQKCEEDLKYAVVNSFYEADKRGMNSIALPAISSAIFAVPMKVCVKQYVRAVAVYSKRRNRTSALSEIHFVDINEETVRAIQVAFEEQYPLSSSRVGANSATYSDEFAGNKDLPEPLMFESSLHQYEFYFMGNIENNMMLLWNINIEHIKGTSAVLVPVDQYGNGGFIGKNIEAKVEYRTEYMQEKKGLFKSPQTVCNVLKNQGYGCGFIFILYAVYPQLEKNKEITVRERSLAKTIASVLNTADKDGKIQSVAIPMFGIDSKKESDIRLFSSIFVETYRQFCQEKWKNHKQNPLKVIVVCHEQKMYKEAQCVFEEYVQKLKPPELTPSDVCAATANDFQQSQKKAEMSDDLKSMDRCVICMDTVTDPKTIKCGHTFCTECIDQQFEYQKRCPTCGTPCGVITGDQPYGTMNDSVNQHKHLPGYEDYDTIYITYNFHGGKQQDCHPNPGTWYKGIQRTAYLPNNEEGRKILKMLRIAFDRKLTFTIGNSRTTGQEGVITWNDIHHKTDPRPNTQFGYPDQTYLARVKDELAAKGVTEDDI